MARESFYVAASRGRESIDVFTDDRAWLQDSIKTTSTRMAALEFEKELGRKGPSMERGADMSVGKGMRG
jgi:ATP-dependent exoDNAse (exonuclease V) alpha subunit